ncbi:glycosyltransferase family 4 protein [Geodermatophilus sp. SYSU D00804]
MVTSNNSTSPHRYTLYRETSQDSPAPGARERSITRGRDTRRGYGRGTPGAGHRPGWVCLSPLQPTATEAVHARVTIVGLNYAPETTGIAPYTTGLARHLARGEYAVTAITGYPHYPEWEVRTDFRAPHAPGDDVGVHLVRVRHPVPRNPGGLSRIWMELVFAFRTLLPLLRSRPDVVVVVCPALLSVLPALLLRPFLRYRIGVVVQDLYGAALTETGLMGSTVGRLAALGERLLLRSVDSVVVIHDVFARRLGREGIPAHRIHVIPNWSHVTVPDGSDREATRRRLGWRSSDFVALHAGNMGVKQGLEGLIAVARLAHSRGSRVHFVLLGDGSQRAQLLDQASGTGNLTFLAPLPAGEFEEALSAADCLVLHEKPGVLEMSVPSKLTTYFAAARPVVAATHPQSGAAALVTAAEAGLVVTAGEPTQILDAVEYLAEHPEEADRYAENGHEYAEEQLSGGASLAAYDAWLADLRGRRSGDTKR